MPTHSPIALSTWSFGHVANAAAMPILRSGGSALDAAVAGATAVELDPTVDSVGVGGLPDASGRVSLDACVMTNPDRCGSVCFLRDYPTAAQIARRVMDNTIHVMLAGDGASVFAASEGFTPDPNQLLTDQSRAAYAAWKIDHPTGQARAGLKAGYVPPMNVEERYKDALSASPDPSHDTVCVLTRDTQGQLAGVCTTSGLGFKIPGRVGDSPIIGHGLYVDQTAGAASCTGNGELVMGVCGSFLAVELMRQGRSPLDAALAVLQRIADRNTLHPSHQVAVIAMNPQGQWASASLRPGFSHCISTTDSTHTQPALKVLFP